MSFWHLSSILFGSALVAATRPVNYGAHVELEHSLTKSSLYSMTKVQWGSGGQLVSALPESMKSTVSQESTAWIVRSTPAASLVLPADQLPFYSTQHPQANRSDMFAAFTARNSGNAVLCGSVIRLEHSESGRTLKSNPSPALVGQGSEVVAGSSGDEDDFFLVECDTKIWQTESPVWLRHQKQNGHYLTTSKKAQFTPQNCPRCPIKRHLDVSATKPTANREPHQWRAHTMMAISLTEDELDEEFGRRDEL